MSLQLVKKFQKRLEDIVAYGGTRNESSVRAAFQQLLSDWAEGSGLRLITEVTQKAVAGNNVRPDGTLKDSLQQSRGYWESKDEADTLDDEIQKKLAKGYPRDNIIFEDSRLAVLMQNGEEVQRVDMGDAGALAGLLKLFFEFEPPQVLEFRKAVDHFKDEMPHLLKILREAADAAEQKADYRGERDHFVEIAKEAINPDFSPRDAREMLIQHILTGDLFTSVFDNAQYHEDNNIAQQLQQLAATFYKGPVKRDIAERTKRYYGAIQAAAAQIADHHEKQRFLKALYENFYRAYNPAGAERLGIFYTPGEIVRFMIEATDTLLEKHFQKGLADKGVEILDPATGTGTFITELIDFLPKAKLEQKYREELHCNELALLPYYIANLNIEATYAQKMGRYEEFRNIVLVDTLDNTGFGVHGQQSGLFGSVTAENLERAKRQNARPVRVIIGNPPYRANQANENDNNKNREYKEIDRRIKATYVAASTAQKTKLYDMYSRFLRWATDRLKEDGIVAFVSNSSFIDSRTFDGFRKEVVKDFDHIYILDMKGNANTSGERRKREGGNVFNDQIKVGVAVYFLVRSAAGKRKSKDTKIWYHAVPDFWRAREKLEWLKTTKFEDIEFDHIRPDAKHNWLGQVDEENDWNEFLPVADKDTKQAKSLGQERAIFKLYSLGVVTNRDEWVYSRAEDELADKVRYFIGRYNEIIKLPLGDLMSRNWEGDIKMTRATIADAQSRKSYSLEKNSIVPSLYRPFDVLKMYFSKNLNEMQYQMPSAFPKGVGENVVIALSGSPAAKPFQVLATDILPSLDLLEKTQCLPFYRYTMNGERLNNITDYALKAFQSHYADTSISREDIFHYVYAVLHHPAYREKYALNLRQEFPRIPFYPEFGRWAAWGRELMALHIGFESVAPYPLKRTDEPPKNDTPEALALAKKARLKVRRDAAKQPTGAVELDGLTTLAGIPAAAWAYKLGNRSALEWVLERHKETTPKDATIREKFNTYRFADHKERVIDLLARVTTVSVETVRIVGEMPAETM